MNIESYCLSLGILNVASPLNKSKLEAMDREPTVVQFCSPLTDREYVVLADFLREHPKVLLRAYDQMAFRITDLEFLKHFSFVKRFTCNLWKLRSLDGLSQISDQLEELHVGWTRSKSLSLSVLSSFSMLRILSVEGHTKHANVISELSELEELTLRSITLTDLDFLKVLPRLWSLEIKLGGTSNLSALPEMGKLKNLELWMIKGLTSIDVISSIPTLQCLFLQALRRVTSLPSFRRMNNLRWLAIDELKDLNDISPVREAPALEDLFVFARHLSPDAFECLRDHPTLERAIIGLGSKRKNAAVDAMLKLPRAKSRKDFKFR